MKDSIEKIVNEQYEYYSKMSQMCKDVLDGKPMTEVCKDNNVSISYFRHRLLRNTSNPTSVSEEQLFAAIKDSMSPEEQIFSEIVDPLFKYDPTKSVPFAPDFEETLYRMIDEFSDNRLKDIIELHFYQDWTFEKIAQKYGVSRERIRQILTRFYKKMRRSDRLLRLIYGDTRYAKYSRNIEYSQYVQSLMYNFEKSEDQLCQYDNLLAELNKLKDNADQNSKQFTNISTLGLNPRTYNCLRHAQIIAVDQLQCMSKPELMSLRGFGENCMENLNSCLLQHGYDAIT